MHDRPQESIDWLQMAEECNLYTIAELEQIVNEAARLALEDRRPISEVDIRKAINDNPRSLNDKN